MLRKITTVIIDSLLYIQNYPQLDRRWNGNTLVFLVK